MISKFGRKSFVFPHNVYRKFSVVQTRNQYDYVSHPPLPDSSRKNPDKKYSPEPINVEVSSEVGISQIDLGSAFI